LFQTNEEIIEGMKFTFERMKVRNSQIEVTICLDENIHLFWWHPLL